MYYVSRLGFENIWKFQGNCTTIWSSKKDIKQHPTNTEFQQSLVLVKYLKAKDETQNILK